MDDFSEYLKKIGDGLKTLEEDVAKIINFSKKEEGDKDDKKMISDKEGPFLKTFQSVTVLRGSKEELEEAQKNPNQTFVKDALNKLFKE